MKLQLAPLHLPLAEGARLCPIVSRRSRVGEEAEWDHVRFTNTGKGNKRYFAFYFLTWVSSSKHNFRVFLYNPQYTILKWLNKVHSAEARI